MINFRSRKKAMTETMDFDKRAVKLKPKDRTHCLVDVYSRKLGGPLLVKDSQRVISQLVDMKTPPWISKFSIITKRTIIFSYYRSH